jgi:hypothetical protein
MFVLSSRSIYYILIILQLWNQLCSKITQGDPIRNWFNRSTSKEKCRYVRNAVNNLGMNHTSLVVFDCFYEQERVGGIVST